MSTATDRLKTYCEFVTDRIPPVGFLKPQCDDEDCDCHKENEDGDMLEPPVAIDPDVVTAQNLALCAALDAIRAIATADVHEANSKIKNLATK